MLKENFIVKMSRDAKNMRTRGFVVQTTDVARARELKAYVLSACGMCNGPTKLVAKRGGKTVARCLWCDAERTATMLHEESPLFPNDADEVELPKERLYVVNPFKTVVEVRIEPRVTVCGECGNKMRLSGKMMVCERDARHESLPPYGEMVEVPLASEASGESSAMTPAAMLAASKAKRGGGKMMPGAPTEADPIQMLDKHLRKAYELMGGFSTQPSVMEHKAVVLVEAYLNNEREKTEGLSHFLRAVAVDETLMQHTHGTVVVFTQNHRVVGEAALQVCEVIVPPVSTPQERREYIAGVVESFKTNPSYRKTLEKEVTEESMAMMVTVTGGLNLEQTSAAVIEMLSERTSVDLDYLANVKRQKLHESGLVRLLEPLEGGFENVGGYGVLKQTLRERLIDRLKFAGRAKRFGLKMPRGAILFGPPGTGKSLLARAVGAETKLPVLEMRETKSKWVGESEANTTQVFAIAASMAPCILFKDEIDTMGGRHSGDTSGVTQSVFGIFLKELQEPDREWFFLGATNVPEALDDALVRPGRVDFMCPMLYADAEARLEVLRVHAVLKKRPLAPDVDLAKLVARTSMFSGAEIESLVERAVEEAFRREVASVLEGDTDASEVVTMQDFENALSNFQMNPPKKEREATFARFLQYAKDHCGDKRLYAPYENWSATEEAFMEAQRGAPAAATSASVAQQARAAKPKRGV